MAGLKSPGGCKSVEATKCEAVPALCLSARISARFAGVNALPFPRSYRQLGDAAAHPTPGEVKFSNQLHAQITADRACRAR